MSDFLVVKVKVINTSSFELPQYKTSDAAGLDLQANISENIQLGPLERKLIPTGLFMELPQGTEAQVRPRSGLALKRGLSVLNAPGTIDADYRGEVQVLLVNISNEKTVIEPGERIAQLVISNYEKIDWEAVTILSDTARGKRGYGHTGTK